MVIIVIMMVVVMIIMGVIIAVSFVVRVVIVFNPAAIALPVAGVVSLAIVARLNPMCSLIWWPSPIALVPFVVLAHRIPISCYPHVPRGRAWWNNRNNSRWRRCPNDDSDRNLGFSCPGQNEKQRD